MNNRKAIFFTGDHHIYHNNVIKYDNRPFEDVEHMHRVLINNHNSVVPKDGICYFMGDIGMCAKDKIKGFLDQLNGTKVLVLGNHDGGVNKMYSIGFDVVVHGLIMKIAGKVVTATHCPLLGFKIEDTREMSKGIDENWYGENNPKHFKIKDNGQYHIHAHTHIVPKKTNGNHFNVTLAMNNYRPVSISEIESWIDKSEQRKKDDNNK